MSTLCWYDGPAETALGLNHDDPKILLGENIDKSEVVDEESVVVFFLAVFITEEEEGAGEFCIVEDDICCVLSELKDCGDDLTAAAWTMMIMMIMMNAQW